MQSSPFSDLGIKPELLSALTKLSITEPTPIQSLAIPILLSQKDAYLQAETGTGKTLAYLLPLYSLLNPAVANAQAIVLAPTHELAIQLEKLKKKPQIVIGSPGRVRELIQAGKLKMQAVRAVVLDEADRMLTSERLADVRQIVESAPKERCVIFVSATEHADCAEAISALAPAVQRIKPSGGAVNSNITHLYLQCEERDKPDCVRKLLHAMAPERAIVFVHKNEMAEMVASRLADRKLSVADIHGVLNKEERKRAMDAIRSGSVQVLIASDVAARGLDVKGVTHVFNLDLPSESEAYLHRVGRTGRAGATGVALSLVNKHQQRLIERLSDELGITMTEVYVWKGELRLAENNQPFGAVP
jgi:superfamily II DNA/RNA helicase